MTHPQQKRDSLNTDPVLGGKTVQLDLTLLSKTSGDAWPYDMDIIIESQTLLGSGTGPGGDFKQWTITGSLTDITGGNPQFTGSLTYSLDLVPEWFRLQLSTSITDPPTTFTSYFDGYLNINGFITLGFIYYNIDDDEILWKGIYSGKTPSFG